MCTWAKWSRLALIYVMPTLLEYIWNATGCSLNAKDFFPTLMSALVGAMKDAKNALKPKILNSTNSGS